MSTKTAREVHEDQACSQNHHQDASIVLQGCEASTVQTTAPDLSPQFGIAAKLFAASVRTPSPSCSAS